MFRVRSTEVFRGFALTGFLLSLAVAAGAEDFRRAPQFGMPIDCDPGRTCWIVNYVDHDPTPDLRDYMCGQATYNLPSGRGHQGTDFAIRDQRALRAGVAVVSVAEGTVTAVRDGMADRIFTDRDSTSLAGRDCGNGVRIDHDDRWSTQYCHMRKGSIAVRPGQRVEIGQRIGFVGLSGFTQFPHVHLTVRRGDKVIDPFVGETREARCGPGPDPLWDETVLAHLPYRPTAIYNGGFAPGKPSLEQIRNGDFPRSTLPVSSPALVLWTEMFNVRAGDRITLRILMPDGEKLIDYADTLKKNQARRFVFAGRPLRAKAWPPGHYIGEIELARSGRDAPIVETRTITLQ